MRGRATLTNYRHGAPMSRPKSSSRPTTPPATSSSMASDSPRVCISPETASPCSTDRESLRGSNPSKNPETKSDKRMYRPTRPLMGVSLCELQTASRIFRRDPISFATSCAQTGSILGGTEGGWVVGGWGNLRYIPKRVRYIKSSRYSPSCSRYATQQLGLRSSRQVSAEIVA